MWCDRDPDNGLVVLTCCDLDPVDGLVLCGNLDDVAALLCAPSMVPSLVERWCVGAAYGYSPGKKEENNGSMKCIAQHFENRLYRFKV